MRGALLSPLAGRGVSGALASACVQDGETDIVAMFQHAMVPEAEDMQSLRLKEFGAPLVVGDLFRMLAAVQFDHEPRLGAVEVDDVRPLRNLATPFPTAELAITQDRPQTGFCSAVVTPKGAGALDRGSIPDRTDLAHPIGP